MRKSQLRQSYLAKRQELSRQDRAAKSLAIADLFFANFDVHSVGHLHCFLPIAKFNEVDTRVILERVWRDHPQIQTVVPRVDSKTNELTSLKFGPDTVLGRNSWGIEEPTHDEFVEAEKIDLVLVPGICFDKFGHRVGYGKGFYDRFLKTCRADCVKIGLSYFEPIDKIDDVYEGDVSLDALVTPDYATRRGSDTEKR